MLCSALLMAAAIRLVRLRGALATPDTATTAPLATAPKPEPSGGAARGGACGCVGSSLSG